VLLPPELAAEPPVVGEPPLSALPPVASHSSAPHKEGAGSGTAQPFIAKASQQEPENQQREEVSFMAT
jgi:hypothetical protein